LKGPRVNQLHHGATYTHPTPNYVPSAARKLKSHRRKQIWQHSRNRIRPLHPRGTSAIL